MLIHPCSCDAIHRIVLPSFNYREQRSFESAYAKHMITRNLSTSTLVFLVQVAGSILWTIHIDHKGDRIAMASKGQGSCPFDLNRLQVGGAGKEGGWLEMGPWAGNLLGIKLCAACPNPWKMFSLGYPQVAVLLVLTKRFCGAHPFSLGLI